MEKRNYSNNGAPVNAYRYVFDDFEVDPANRECRRGGQPLHLTARVFDILVVFAENPGRLLKKDELIEKVWSAEFVEDGNLARNISTLRRALDDDLKDRKYIVTVPGHGYRFIPQVTKLRAPADEVARETADISPVANGTRPALSPLSVTRKLNLRVAALIVTLGLLIAAGSSFWWRAKLSGTKGSKSLVSIENIRPKRLTSTGDVYGPVISPDGKYIAYSSGSKIRVEQLASGTSLDILPPVPNRLLGTVQYWGVLFSADSDYIYFTIVDDDNNSSGTLYRVPVLGGRAEKIMDRVNTGALESPDGKHLVFVRADPAAGLSRLMMSNRDGTNQQVLSTIDMNSLFSSLDWSPDGKKVLYTMRQHTADGYSYYVAEIPVTGGAEVRIVPSRRDRILSARWLPKRGGLITSAADPITHKYQLYYVTYPDGDEQRLTNDLTDHRSFTITADGQTMLEGLSKVTTQVWVAPRSELGRAAPLASSTSALLGISWTPENQILYGSEKNGLRQIFRMERDGSHVQQLTDSPGHNNDPVTTPDGRYIAFISGRSGANQIWRMNANGSGSDAVQLTHSKLDMFKPQSSPDGQWIYFTADAHGQWQVRKVPITGGDDTVVEETPVQFWALSPDGRLLAYSFFDEQLKKTRIAVRQLDQSKPFKYFDVAPSMSLQWTPDRRELTYIDSKSGDSNIWLQPLDGSPARPLTALSADQWISTFAWSADGKTLAYTRVSTSFDAAILELQ